MYMKSSIAITLASSSKYRAELLKRTSLIFSQTSPDVNEDIYKDKIKDPLNLAIELAKLKAIAVHQKLPNNLCIGSDQVVSLNTEIFGKAGSEDAAFNQLKKLNGKTHQLITAVCITYQDKTIEFQNITKLKMRSFSDSQLRTYILLDNPIDCAGSYKLESYGISLFEEIQTTDSTSVIGLPMIELTSNLIKLGVDLF